MRLRAGAAALVALATLFAGGSATAADPHLKTYVFRTPAHTIGPYSVIRRNEAAHPPPVDGSIVAMSTHLVDAKGKEIPQSILMLHHIVFANGGPDGKRHDQACPERPAKERFFGTSEELRALTLPRGYGYRYTARDQWRTIWMIMNHTQHIHTAYVEYRMTVDTDPAVRPVTPYWLSVTPCRTAPDPQFSVPGGKKRGSLTRRSRLWRIPRAGRIVAIGGHMHGGGMGVGVSQPRCGNRRIFMAKPTYAPRGDPLYKVRPLLHEPDPKSISWQESAGGWPVERGEKLRVSSVYEAARPHTRVMGIAHVYVADGAPGPTACGAVPKDLDVLGPGFRGRARPPRVRLTLALFDGRGRARSMLRAAGRERVLDGSTTVRVKRFRFHPANLSIPAGSRIRWVFGTRTRHDVTVVTGPRGFATPWTGHSASHRFTVPGLYRMHCSLHPVTMNTSVRVRRK